MSIHTEPILCVVRGVQDLRTPEDMTAGIGLEARFVRYNVVVNLPEGAIGLDGVELQGWKPPSPMQVTPRAIGSQFVALRVNKILSFPVDEYPAWGPCRPRGGI